MALGMEIACIKIIISRAIKTIVTLIFIKEIEVCNYRGKILLSGLVDDVSPRSAGDKTSSRNRAGNAWYNRAGNAWFKRAGNEWFKRAGNAWYNRAGNAWFKRSGNAWFKRAGNAWFKGAGNMRIVNVHGIRCRYKRTQGLNVSATLGSVPCSPTFRTMDILMCERLDWTRMEEVEEK
jgi:hypothetical protein